MNQIPPTENDGFISRLSTLHEAEDPALRPASIIMISPAFSLNSEHCTTAASSPTYHLAPNGGDTHSIDGTGFGAPRPSETTNSVQIPAQSVTHKYQSPVHKAKGTIVLQWWRELVATVFSITSMVLVLVLVLKIQNTALGYWNFHIGSLTVQPNTLISVLTTIGQTLMMVPVTACIGQLKWKYFRRARHLHHMQLMDDASRGPWGSLLLLSRLASTRAATASLLALVTIMALGIGPSAQQILEFRPAQVLLKNATAGIGFATNYSSKSYVSQYDRGSGRAYYTTTYNSDIFKLQSSVIDGIAGTVFAPNFNCPGDTCNWPVYTSLGICGNYYNLTESVEPSCWGDDYLLNCTYEVPRTLTASEDESIVTLSFSDQSSPLDPPTTIFQSNWIMDANSLVGIFSFKVANAYHRSPSGSAPAAEISFSTWNWCAKTYSNDTASPAGITGGTVVSEELFQSGFLSDENGDAGSGSIAYKTQSGSEFYVDHNSQLQLFGWLGRFLERSIEDRYPHTGTQMDDDSFNLGFFLYASNLSKVTQDIAETLTNQIRSTHPGDNLNSTTLEGEAYVFETYIRIRWQWIVLPLAETVLTCVLLAVSIATTSSEPLLKSSVLAFLFYPLEGLKVEDPNMNEPDTVSKLERRSKAITAKLEPGEAGRFNFRTV